jgi:hypothetical protein
VLGSVLDGLHQAQILLNRAANVVVIHIDMAQNALVVDDKRATEHTWA